MSPTHAILGLNGVFHCSPEQASACQRAAEAQRYITASIDLPKNVTAATVFEGFASAMRFPEWFGANWDALADCLMDLSWLDEKGYLIILRGCGAAFPDQQSVWPTLIGILQEAAEYWRDEGVPFSVLLDDAPDLPKLPELPDA